MGDQRHSPYLNDAITDAKGIVERTLESCDPDSFDAICVTGVSGMLIGPILAYLLDKRLAVVRKTRANSHAECEVEHNFEAGDRWIFVDDLIASGETIQRVQNAMLYADLGEMTASYLYNSNDYRKRKATDQIFDRAYVAP